MDRKKMIKKEKINIRKHERWEQEEREDEKMVLIFEKGEGEKMRRNITGTGEGEKDKEMMKDVARKRKWGMKEKLDRTKKLKVLVDRLKVFTGKGKQRIIFCILSFLSLSIYSYIYSSVSVFADQ